MNNNKIIRAFSFFLFLMTVTGCGLDNYKGPQVQLTGKIVYQDNTVFLRHGTVSFDLYQQGYELNEPIKVYVSQDGTFSSLLFPGVYTMTATDNNGPWMNGSTPIEIDLKSDLSVDYQVTPYFVMSDVAIVLSGNTIRAICNVSKVAGELSTRRLSLFINTSAIVGDNTYNYALRKNLMPVNIGGNSITCDVTELLGKDTPIYARLGLQTEGVSEMIYSQVIKLK